ncbi:hypothetical protein [uncultured Sphingomonas sp.]|uniref:hypothetical protein n=1 Tax=uncultured Sphingomonas sp. TaxID=158754 RepID=UPI0035CA617C
MEVRVFSTAPLPVKTGHRGASCGITFPGGVFERGLGSGDDDLVVVDRHVGDQQPHIGSAHGAVFGQDAGAQRIAETLDRFVGDLVRSAAELPGEAALGLGKRGNGGIGLSELGREDRIAHAHHPLLDDLEQPAEPRLGCDPLAADSIEIAFAALFRFV